MIQTETATARPTETTAGESVTTSPGFRKFMGAWETYSEEERSLLAKYEGGFSEALQAQSENITTRSDEVTAALKDYWKYYGEEERYRHRYREKKRRLGKGTGKYKRRYRAAAESKKGALDAAREARKGLYDLYVPLEWAPPKMTEAPSVSVFAPQKGRGIQPQVQTTTARTSNQKPLAAATSSEAQLFQKEKMGLHARQKVLREELAKRYKALIGMQEQRFGSLRDAIDEAIRKAEEKEGYLHERHT